MEIAELKNQIDFKQFHESMNADRKDKLFKEVKISRKYPKQIKKLAKGSNELKDYLHYLDKGGTETPELTKGILSRAKSSSNAMKIEKRKADNE